jgi:gliding motility-associated-like protein
VDSNYVVKLDGASYITWRALTIKPLDDDYGRGFVLDGKASYDSIVNCIIVLPAASSSSDDISGVYADALSGEYNVIAGNNITNGANGIYLRATSAALHTSNNVIDSNTVTGAYYYSIYISNNERIRVTKNTVNISAPRNSTSYGIYSTGSDSAYVYTGNTVNISNTTTTVYGMYFTGCDASETERGRVEANKIIAVTGNTGTLYGMYHSSSDNINNLNNVIALATSGSTTYGIYCTSGSGAKYYNNSVRTSSSSNTNRTAYFSTSSSTYGPTDIRNNIFSNEGDGAAMYIGNTNHIYSDYNMFYTTGSTLIEWGSNEYATLQEWRDTAYWDIHSIVYKPAFTSATDLMPDVNDPNVWAIHGRGVQIEGNSYDFNNNDRPVTLQAGVPDLGAYEFVPSSIPVELTATPADPAPGTTQVFMLGTDTVTKITWAPGSTVPTTITGRRYSGVVPPGLATGPPFMYFYTDFDTTGTAPANYSIEQFYLDPWQGLINSQRIIKMGRTLSGGNWFVSSNSAVNELTSTISESQLSFIDKFTGLTDGTAAAPPPSDLITTDSSNRGTRFWVAYGHHYDFSSNSQDMVLYLSAEEAANVQVKINGTSWVRNYSIPANTAIVSDVIPKSGLIDARITDEGLFNNAISIVSDVPIVAYAHIYNGSNSGAGMLLPVGVYGYDYTSLNSHQYYPGNAYSWFYIIADRDSTMVEITPSVTTKHGRPANTPFIVMLNKGQVYNVMGTTDGSLGSDLTGSRIRSIPNASGKCQPIAVFSGSSRTALCNTTNGDNFIQQVFPNTAWGTKYLTFATANSTSDNEYNSNIFRVMVKDPATHVTLNGNLLDPATLVVPGNYYEFSTTQGNGPNGAINIESNKPVLMAQYMVSTNAHQCTGVTADGDGDPELIYISPVQQGIKKAVFYNTDESSINSNYINVVVPTAGLSTLTIDGASTFTDVFVHPYDSNYTCVRYNLGDTAGQHIIQCDSAFTAITYGLGLVESYGYNAGTLVKNLNAYTSIANTLADGSVSDYTCPGAPFRFSMKLNLKPNTIVWHFSQVSNLTPNADVSQSNPVPTDSALVNGAWYYTYVLPQDYVYSSTTAFVVPISISHPDIESCNNSMDITLQVPVKPKPFTDFDTTFSGCVSDPVQFSGISNPYPGATVNKWTWDFGDATADSVQNPVKQYLAPGTYNVKLQAIGTDGCIGDTIKPVVVNGPAAVELEEDSIIACLGSDVTFRVANPSASVTYNWYDSLSAGTLLGTGDSYTISAISSAATIYVEAVEAGCAGFPRAKAVLMVSPPLTKPVAAVDSVGTDLVRFRWNAVPNATGYEVSIDNGLNWITPSSGPNGLIHLVTGLQSNQTITLMVKAKGCEDMVSDPVSGTTVPDGIFIPNAFTPNGDGLNDVLKVYSYLIKDMHFMVFNQWGEKIFESTNQSVAWDGSYKGRIQPSGVYMYVCRMTLKDGRVITKKGAINLVR